MNDDFTLISDVEGNTLVLRTDGYINNTGGERIMEEFSRHSEKGITKVVMDLAKSKVVNSMGISYMIDLIEQLSENGGKLVFTNLDPTIEKTLDLMGIFQFAEKESAI
jgi:anti-anti-sigma factor